MRRKLAAGVALAAALFGAALPAAATSGMHIAIGSPATLAAPGHTTALVPVTVECERMDEQTAGLVTVALTQAVGSRATAGTGSAPVACDGTAHEYLVPVAADEGRWLPVQATASASGQATGYRNFTLCVQHGPGGPIECRSFQLGMRVEGTAGPTTIQLVPQGRAP